MKLKKVPALFVTWKESGALRLASALIIGLLAVVSAISSISYMVHWKEDQSLLAAGEFFSGEEAVGNAAGILGSSLGAFLVGDLFGICALVLCLLLFAVAVRLVRQREVQWMRILLAAIPGICLLGMLLGYVSVLCGDAVLNLFGNGLGGGACTFVAESLLNICGPIVTPIIILTLLAVFAVLMFPEQLAIMLSRQKQDERVEAEELDDVQEGQLEQEMSAPAAEESFSEEVQEETSQVLEAVPVQEFAEPEYAWADTSGADAGTDAADDVVDDDGVNVVINGPEDSLSTDIEEELPALDIRSDVDRYTFPSLDLLEDYSEKRYPISEAETQRNAERIKAALASFKISIESIKASVGYTVTLYRIILGEGVRLSQVKNREEDIAIKIGIKGVRVVKLDDAVGIEVPNDRPSVVPLKAILNSDAFRNSKAELPIAVGYTITTKAKVFDLADAPHLLVAGATKQGKSVGLNAIISSLLYCKHPTELKFVFIDPKMVEFQKYSKLIDHYLAVLPVAGDSEDEAKSAIVTDPKNAEAVLNSLCVEMDERYKLMSAAGENKITDYNEKFRNRRLLPTEGHHFLPYLVVVVDEYADLTKSTFGTDRNLSRSIENSINRLAAKGRAAGLHVIIATQRPSVDVITGTIKGNFPTRMAFRTAQRQDSQTILGIPGAERLIGKGDMLFFTGAEAERVQCALVDTVEIERLTSYIASQQGYKQRCSSPYYLPEPLNPDGSPMGGDSGPGGLVDMKNLDPMFEEAAKLAVLNQQISTSFIQRKLQLGFARAGRVMDQLESAGVVGPQSGAKSREVLVPDLASLQSILDAYCK